MNYTKWTIVFVGLLVVLGIANTVFVTLDTIGIFAAAKERKEAERPAVLSATLITPRNCGECLPLTPFLDVVKQNNVRMEAERTLAADDAEAKQAIEKYGIEKLPALLMTGELEKSAALQDLWKRMGEMREGTFIYRAQRPPYEEVATGATRGTFSVTYLTDTKCTTCYDVMGHAGALQNLGMMAADDQVVDVASTEGRALRMRYAITAVPTILLSGDLAVYPGLQSVWPGVGTVEKDGTYVFREKGMMAAQMGMYRDMKTGKIMTPPMPTQ